MPSKFKALRDDKMIPSIHNWCDRWCERCPFIDRCTVGVMERKHWAKGQEISDTEVWQEVHENFQEALQMLDEMIREAGFDPEEIKQDAPPEPDPRIEVLGKKWFDDGIRYFKAMDGFFKNNEAFFKSKDSDMEWQVELKIPVDVEGWNDLSEAIEIIRQYAAFIPVKGRRAISGLSRMEEDYWDSPLQSDGNGSAKITLITIERSLRAWEILRKNWPEKTDEILDMLVQLDQMRREMAVLFPGWQAFVRPGFDTEPPQFARFEPN